MITDQEAREAALRESLARISDHKRGVAVPRYADKAALTLPSMLLADLCMVAECYQQELARREAERIERAKRQKVTEQWRNANEPPCHSRNILLRFDETGDRDCVGFYDLPYQAYCTWQDRGRVGGFVTPVKWREMDSTAEGGAS